MGMTCLAIVSMTALFIGLVVANSRKKNEKYEAQILSRPNGSTEPDSGVEGDRYKASRYQL